MGARRFEIPLAAKRMAESGKYDAVIALGAVDSRSHEPLRLRMLRGFKGVANVALGADIPVMFGVTTDTIEQAIERAGTKAGNKGAECAGRHRNGEPASRNGVNGPAERPA